MQIIEMIWNKLTWFKQVKNDYIADTSWNIETIQIIKAVA